LSALLITQDKREINLSIIKTPGPSTGICACDSSRMLSIIDPRLLFDFDDSQAGT